MKQLTLLIILMFLSISTNHAMAELNWSSVPEKKITLFYSGITNWQYLVSEDHNIGARKINKNKSSCKKCHVNDDGQHDLLVDEITSGKLKMKKSQKYFEPNPIPDKEGFLSSTLQAGYDHENIYIKIEWKSKGYGWYDKSLAEKGLSDTVAFQVNKDNVQFKKYGCMMSCHTYSNNMPNSPTEEDVKNHPYYSNKNKDKIGAYTVYSRKDGGNWADIKSEEELKALIEEGGLVDLWQGNIEGSQIISKDGWILEDHDTDKNDVNVTGEYKDGKYSVLFKRKLNTDDIRDVRLSENDEFSLALSIQDNMATKRQHYISFPFTIGIGTSGDIQAVKFN